MSLGDGERFLAVLESAARRQAPLRGLEWGSGRSAGGGHRPDRPV
jgi:hypothetical protein